MLGPQSNSFKNSFNNFIEQDTRKGWLLENYNDRHQQESWFGYKASTRKITDKITSYNGVSR